jgi:hypothetical protein
MPASIEKSLKLVVCLSEDKAQGFIGDIRKINA